MGKQLTRCESGVTQESYGKTADQMLVRSKSESSEKTVVLM